MDDIFRALSLSLIYLRDRFIPAVNALFEYDLMLCIFLISCEGGINPFWRSQGSMALNQVEISPDGYCGHQPDEIFVYKNFG